MDLVSVSMARHGFGVLVIRTVHITRPRLFRRPKHNNEQYQIFSNAKENKHTTPLFNEPIDSDLKEFVVGKCPMCHDYAVIELVVGSSSLRRPVIVAQFDHLPFPLVKPKFIAVDVGRHHRGSVIATLRRYC